MRRVPDTTGRLLLRPHYDVAELDTLCEQLITDFMEQLHRALILPIPTDDLEKLIERDAADLDLYADLSGEGDDVEGVTYFIPNEKPRVCISSALSEAPHREHRLRTTLTHEYGHVKLHAPLWDTPATQLRLFEEPSEVVPQKCHRATILGTKEPDWMEWQAGYVCSALLMPISIVRQHVQTYFERYRLPTQISSASHEGINLLLQLAAKFDVSRDAARVRLSKLSYLVDDRGAAPFVI